MWRKVCVVWWAQVTERIKFDAVWIMRLALFGPRVLICKLISEFLVLRASDTSKPHPLGNRAYLRTVTTIVLTRSSAPIGTICRNRTISARMLLINPCALSAHLPIRNGHYFLIAKGQAIVCGTLEGSIRQAHGLLCTAHYIIMLYKGIADYTREDTNPLFRCYLTPHKQYIPSTAMLHETV